MMKKSSLFIFFFSLVLVVCSCTEASKDNGNKTLSDTQEHSILTKYYQEKHRPQFHFSPAEKWMNDPNGMVYYEGEYHLFYQYYPDSTVWGPMHWGHAVSPDMVTWEHLPIALYPDSLGYIFSGSAVVDKKNTSGLGENGKPPLVAIFTHHDAVLEKKGRNDFQYQSIAYSNDKGRTWTKYTENPVIPNVNSIRDFRDPKVIWDEIHKQWLMVFAAKDRVQFWASKNLIDWNFLSDWGNQYGNRQGVWECPEIFPIQTENKDETKWVLLLSINPGHPNSGSGTQYFVGNFDGKNFKVDPSFAKDIQNGKGVWLDYGRDNYAGVTWSNVPKADGRRLFLGWMSNWDYAQVVPTEKWRSAMTLPRSMTLIKNSNGYRIHTTPVKELEKLRTKTFLIEPVKISEQLVLTDKFDFDATQSELSLSIDMESSTAQDFGIELSNLKGEKYYVGYDVLKKEFYSDRRAAGKKNFSEKFAATMHTAPNPYSQKGLNLRIFFDKASTELFVNDGQVVMTDIVFPTEDFNTMKLYSKKGKVVLKEGKIYSLNRIW